jgi:hypothetical protein
VRRLALVALVALACGPISAHAQTLSLTYHSGDVSKYKVHVVVNESIDAGVTTLPIKIDISALETVTVKSVDSSGTADLLLALSNLSVAASVNGVTNRTNGGTFPPVDVKVGADGRVLSTDSTAFGGGGMSSLAGMGGNYQLAVLPDKPVKPGDAWSKNYDQTSPSGSGTSHVTTTSKYLRDESFQGVNTAVVQTSSKISFDLSIDLSKIGFGQMGSSAPVMPGGAVPVITLQGTASSDATTWLDPSGHRVLKTHVAGKSNGTITVPQSSGSAALMGPISAKGDETMDMVAA